MCTKDPVLAYVNHANLAYYRHPQKINRQVARYISTLADYNLKIVHKPEITNRADALSHRPDFDDGMSDNKNITALPDQLFINHINTTNLYEEIQKTQWINQHEISELSKIHHLEQINQSWFKDRKLLVVGPNDLKRGVTKLYHDTIAAEHPGISNTLFSISRDYWWPRMKQ